MSRRPRDTASARSHTSLPLATVHTRLRQLALAFAIAFAIAIAIAVAATAAFAFASATSTIIAPGTAVTAVTAPPDVTTPTRHPPGATPRTPGNKRITAAWVVVHPPKNSNAERSHAERHCHRPPPHPHRPPRSMTPHGAVPRAQTHHPPGATPRTPGNKRITAAWVVVHPPNDSNAERCRTGRPRCVPALPPTPHPCRPILLNDRPGHKDQDHQRPAPSARSSTAHSPSCPAARPGRPPSSEGPVGSRTPPRLRCAPRSSRGRASGRHGLQTGPRARLPEGRQARGAPRAPTSRPTALGWGGGALSPRAAVKTSQTGAPLHKSGPNRYLHKTQPNFG